jgi:hypothetical protein
MGEGVCLPTLFTATRAQAEVTSHVALHLLWQLKSPRQAPASRIESALGVGDSVDLHRDV